LTCVFFSSLILTLALVAPAAAGDADRYEIRLLGERFTPTPGVSPALQKRLEARAAELRAKGQETVHVLVQLQQVPSFPEKQALWRDGLDLGAYVPGNAWIAAVPVDRLSALAKRSEVRWLTLWDAERKLHPRLKAGELAPYARDPERPGWVMLMLQLHHDVDVERGRTLVEAMGGAAMEPIDGIHGMTVWLPEEKIGELAGHEEVLWLEEGAPPLTALNDGARANMRADAVIGAPFNLDGSGVDLFVFDAGRVRASHVTFNAGSGSRVTSVDADAVADHPTHVAGTAAGDGSGSSGGRARGVATGAGILTAGYQQTAGSMLFWDNAGDIQADYAAARNTFGADLGTNSIGSNTAANGSPCSREGDYGVSSNMIDGIVRGDNAAVSGPMIMTWANGNERSGGTPRGRCGSNYLTTAPPSCAKNPIQVGAINSDGGSMTSFSSWGPCDDGRLKPVISAPGCESGRVSGEAFIFSSLSTSDTAYGGSGWCGTSMATPATAGVVSLLIEDWRALGHGGANDRPLPALVKAMLIQTARDQGQAGPDFIYGYGAVDAEALITLLRDGDGILGSGSANWGSDAVGNGATDSFNVTVPAGTGELKVSLAWDDAAAAAFAATALVNDLDLELVAPDNTVHRPFVLNAASPQLPATTGVNTVDNQEQVVVENPQAGTWTIRVVGSSVPSGPQSYGLAYRASPQSHDGSGCSTSAWGWETGNDGWTLTGAARVAAPAAGHGSTSLRLGGAASSTHEATLDFAVPADAVEAEWSFFWHMTTNEGSDGHGFDNFTAEVRDLAGNVLSVIDARNDGWAQGAWMAQENVDLTPWVGQTVRLAFRATNDSILTTSFFVDDAQVRSCAASGTNTAPAVVISAPADGASFTEGSAVSFAGSATDAEDGDLSASLTWSSSLDGTIGSGASFQTTTLSAGSHTITASVTDSGGLAGSAQISITIDPAPPGGCPDCIDWTTTTTVSYSNQDASQNVTVEDGGATLLLQDNTWRRTTQTFAVTADTVLEFDFMSTAEGEIHGIGFDEDNSISSNRVFQLHGTQNWGIGGFTYTTPGAFQTFRIRVGDFYTGASMFLVLVNDNDAGSGNNSRFRNVRIFEDAPVGCTVDDDFESGAAGWTNSAASTCSTGDFVLATPTAQSSGGVTTQVGGDHTSGTGNAIFTATNTSAGNADVDSGTCILDSPTWNVGAASTLSVWYFHGQRDTGDDPGDDFFLLEVSTDGGVTYSPIVSLGDVRTTAAWTEATASIPAGSDVRLRLQVADGAGPGDIIEGGIDDLSICPN